MNSSRCYEQTTQNEAGKWSFKDGRQSQEDLGLEPQNQNGHYNMDILNVEDC